MPNTTSPYRRIARDALRAAECDLDHALEVAGRLAGDETTRELAYSYIEGFINAGGGIHDGPPRREDD